MHRKACGIKGYSVFFISLCILTLCTLIYSELQVIIYIHRKLVRLQDLHYLPTVVLASIVVTL